MSWLEPLSTLLQSPWLLLLMALVVGCGWALRRKHFYLLWMAAGVALWAWAKYQQQPQHAWTQQWLPAYLYWAGACCMAQSMAMRFGRIVSFYVVVGCSLLLLLGFVLLTYVQPQSQVLEWVATWILAAILGHVLMLVWRSAKRHQAEAALQWIYTALIVALAVSPWQSNAAWSLLSGSSWVLIPLVGLLCSAMLSSAFCDGAAGVRTDVHCDPVTGLLNRTGLEKNCGALPSEKQITVMVLGEIDHFARFQQQFGMSTAHVVLCNFAALLQSNVREGDWVARIGEQEFALALRSIALGDAQELVRRINQSLRLQHWANKGKQGPITASFSIAMVREQDSLNLALHRADVLLCQANDEGSNRMAVDGHTYGEVAVFS